MVEDNILRASAAYANLLEKELIRGMDLEKGNFYNELYRRIQGIIISIDWRRRKTWLRQLPKQNQKLLPKK